MGAPEEELDALNDLFRKDGFEVQSKGGIVELSAVEYAPWIVAITVGGGLVNFLRAFTSKLGELAAEDAWPALKELVQRITAARGGRANGSIEIHDSLCRSTIHVRLDLPDEAYRRLFELDWSNVRGGIGWNEAVGDWTAMDGTALAERTDRSGI